MNKTPTIRKHSHFFAYMARLKLIKRWGLMRNTQPENNAEHTAQVAMIAHGLAVLQSARYNGNLDAGFVAALALYHDVGEVITGDLATPIKYFNPLIKEAFFRIEDVAARKLLDMLPDDLHPTYGPLLAPDMTTLAWRLVKAADRIAAYAKCVEEIKAGNSEFALAAESILKSIEAIDIPAVRDFMNDFAPSYALSLDELD
ncbi:MAG: 5'-deoxynucleotidase [Clostridia bacterium]|nr:5'-deoxynucleotidase [Clostridia bacterium]